uniref:Uncharacterized protein n=1 Tax=Salix viminalis TaxID=40686 RepID=A0A6N2KL53_SALVM
MCTSTSNATATVDDMLPFGCMLQLQKPLLPSMICAHFERAGAAHTNYDRQGIVGALKRGDQGGQFMNLPGRLCSW